jgi:HK97 family phage portal protein
MGWLFGTGKRARGERREPRITAASPENPSTSLANPDAWLLDWANGGAGSFGPPISEQSAMRVSAVYRCVSIISGLIAALPLNVYRDSPTAGRTIARDHRLYRMLHLAPYPGSPLTSFAWREQWGINVLLWGNHYSITRYDGAGRVIGFVPVMPWRVEVFRRAGRNVYVCTLEDGTREAVSQDDILHFPGPGFDGIKGLSRIQAFARDAIGLARTLEQQTGTMHENAARPSGMMELPGSIQPAGMRRIESHFNEHSAGRLNTGRVLFVDKDTKYTPFQMTAEDLNTLEFRRYQAADICRFYGVPPHLIGEAAGTSAWGSGIEQLTLGFLKYTLEPDLQRIEHEINMKLFDGTPYYAEFDREALLTMDAATAASVQQTEINSGTLLINEARARKNRGRVAGGDEPLVNSTMIPLQRALNPPAPPPQPAAPPPHPAGTWQG